MRWVVSARPYLEVSGSSAKDVAKQLKQQQMFMARRCSFNPIGFSAGYFYFHNLRNDKLHNLLEPREYSPHTTQSSNPVIITLPSYFPTQRGLLRVTLSSLNLQDDEPLSISTCAATSRWATASPRCSAS